jgi:1-(5-phosphoribosyl)-5-[(5-phosphoribosylamino)methylideneamino] imidazole-4-carboxamide isomerase/N-(5'phosphoribosyl)anthranilate isomerase
MSGSTDPLRAALAWQRAGARWVHLVDLDAAYGRGSNAELIAAIVGELDVSVQLSGGIYDETALGAALATGCQRAVIGTIAMENPDWVYRAVAQHGGRVAVGLDVADRLGRRGYRLAPRGGDRQFGSLTGALARLESAGCARFVVTESARDGALTGPNLSLLRYACRHTSRPVIASGGVSSLADLRALGGLAGHGVEAAIVGKALYTGAFTIEQALTALEPLWMS